MIRLTDDESALIGEAVLRNLKVQRGRTLPDTAGDVVVRTVAGAEPAAKVTGFTDRDTTKVGANTKHDKPLGLLNTVLIGLRITESLPLNGVGLVDFILGTVTDEDGLSTPLDDDVLALRDGSKADFDLSLSEDIGRGGHVDQEVLNSSLGTNSRGKTEGTGHEVREDLVGAWGLLGGIFAEVRDLVGRGFLGAGERALEG